MLGCHRLIFYLFYTASGYWHPNWFFAFHIIENNYNQPVHQWCFLTHPGWLLRLSKMITLTINLCSGNQGVFCCCLAMKNYIKQQSIWHAGYILANLQRQQPGYNYHFSEVKKTSNSITYKLHCHKNYGCIYIYKSLKNIVWSDSFWLPSVSSQTIIIFTFNMLLVNEKLFFRSQRPQTHFVMSSNGIRIMVGYILNHHNVVTGDDYLVFPSRILLYSLSLSWYLKMFTYFSEVKKT